MSIKQKRILYIEDDIANRVLVRKLLKAENFEVLEAEDGLTGMDMAKQENPDLILMDMNMPGLDGYESTTSIKNIEKLKTTPIIAITANILDGDRDRSLIAGCDGYISKPIDVDTFASVVTEYLDGRRETIEPSSENEYLKEYSNRLVERLEDKIRRLTKALEQEEKLHQLKTEFLATMTHELRTPLNGIMGFAGILKDELGNTVSQDQNTYLESIQTSGIKLIEMLDDIMELNSLEADMYTLNKQMVPIQEVINDCVEKNKADTSKKNLDVQVELQNNLPPVSLDLKLISQTIQHIIKNAIKFTDAGYIEISCRQVKHDDSKIIPDIAAQLEANEDFLLFSVRDSGIGINNENLQTVFDLCHQVDGSITRKHGGTGLGLAYAKKVIELHGGNIWVTSEAEKGSDFSFILPIHAS